MDWMEEFDAFEDPSGKVVAGETGGPKKRNAGQVKELEQEMKLLHWHKLANEAALKAALIRTKKLKAASNNPLAAVESRRERAQWMQQIIEEEQNKPLEVNEDFILNYEKREREEEERLEEEVQRHIESLQKIKQNLRNKEEVRRRTIVYREKRKALQNSRGHYETSASESGGLPPGILQAGGQQPESDGFALAGLAGVSGQGPMQGTLSKVINSLDKLVDLEKRISRLETDVGPDSPVGDNTQKRTRIKFTKRRAESQGKIPARNVFSVTEVPLGRRRGGGGASMGGASRGRKGRSGGRSSTFLTQGGGGGSTRSRSRSRDPVVGNWLEQKNNSTVGRRQAARAKGDPTRRTRGGRRRGKKQADAGPPMQKFSDIRRQFEDRKDKFKRQLNSDSIKSKKRSTSRTRGRSVARQSNGRGRSTGASSRASLASTRSTGSTGRRSRRARSQVAQRSSRKKNAWGKKGDTSGLSISGNTKLPRVR
jgi:hypothetical protein